MSHDHYFRDVSRLERIDVYRVLRLFEVTDPCIQHAVKKLLVAGGRGAKSVEKDVQEAIDSLKRWQSMRSEDGVGPFGSESSREMLLCEVNRVADGRSSGQ